jgi:hypothetical protein
VTNDSAPSYIHTGHPAAPIVVCSPIFATWREALGPPAIGGEATLLLAVLSVSVEISCRKWSALRQNDLAYRWPGPSVAVFTPDEGQQPDARFLDMVKTRATVRRGARDRASPNS